MNFRVISWDIKVAQVRNNNSRSYLPALYWFLWLSWINKDHSDYVDCVLSFALLTCELSLRAIWGHCLDWNVSAKTLLLLPRDLWGVVWCLERKISAKFAQALDFLMHACSVSNALSTFSQDRAMSLGLLRVRSAFNQGQSTRGRMCSRFSESEELFQPKSWCMCRHVLFLRPSVLKLPRELWFLIMWLHGLCKKDGQKLS